MKKILDTKKKLLLFQKNSDLKVTELFQNPIIKFVQPKIFFNKVEKTSMAKQRPYRYRRQYLTPSARVFTYQKF